MNRLRKGDRVIIITGKDKGKVGVIVKLIFKDSIPERCVIEGANIIKKHTKPTQKNPDGGVISREASIHVSNVMLYDGTKRSRVKSQKVDGKFVRVYSHSGKQLTAE